MKIIFYKAQVTPGGLAIFWDDFVDLPSDGIFEFGYKISLKKKNIIDTNGLNTGA